MRKIITAEKRVKSLAGSKKGIQLEVSKNIDLNTSIEQQLEKENELDLDLEQADNKFNKEEAIKRAEKISKQFFYEEDQKENQGMGSLTGDFLIRLLFNECQDMKFITSKALDLVIQDYNLFLDGIDIDNLPLGLAYKDHILFTSDQRRASMPIDEFTIKLNYIKPHISNSLEYSWLPFATRGSISLNDIYGSEIAPKVYGNDEHPAIKNNKLTDLMLDIPFNWHNMYYDFVPGRVQSFTGGAKADGEMFLDRFSGIHFYNLSSADLQKLNEIYDELQKRGMAELFKDIILGNYIADGGFLLEGESTLFLKKLFQEILPLSDYKKQEFFKKILVGYKFRRNSFLEDIFEGLDGFYKKLNEFIISNEITPVFKERIVAKSIEVIKKQIERHYSFKVTLSHFINLLRLVLSHGGNIEEQLEYLDSEDGIFILSPGSYKKAKELGINIIHPSFALDSKNEFQPDDKKNIFPDTLITLIAKKDYSCENMMQNHELLNYELLINSLRYIARLHSHQRPSITTYVSYFY